MGCDWTCLCGRRCESVWKHCPDCGNPYTNAVERYPEEIRVVQTYHTGGRWNTIMFEDVCALYVRKDRVKEMKL